MLNKIYVAVSAAILSFVAMVSGANAAVVTPPVVDTINTGDFNAYIVLASNEANWMTPFTHTFTFDSNHTGAVRFDLDTSTPAGGVADLTFEWTTGSGNTFVFTDGLGVENGAVNPFFEAMVSGGQYVLEVTGTFLSQNSHYTVNVSAVPLPPAVIAFSTAMLGVGFLARRRRKQKALFS